MNSFLRQRNSAEEETDIEKLYSYSEAGKIQMIRSYGQLVKEEYREDGIYVEAYIQRNFRQCLGGR